MRTVSVDATDGRDSSAKANATCDCGISGRLSRNGTLVVQLNPNNELLATVKPVDHRREESTNNEADVESRSSTLTNSSALTDSSALTETHTSDSVVAEIDAISIKPETPKLREFAGKEKLPAKKKPSTFAVVGLTFVAGLFGGALIVFLSRHLGSSREEAISADKRTALSSSTIPAKVDPGTLMRWMRQAPAPFPPRFVFDLNKSSAASLGNVDTRNDFDVTAIHPVDESSKPESHTRVPAPTKANRPKPKNARSRLEVPRVNLKRNVLGSPYQQAYQQYEIYQEAKQGAKNADLANGQLVNALSTTRAAYDIEMRAGRVEDWPMLLYLLTDLSLKAGHLEEAIVYGTTLARHGDTAEVATRDAALLALAATQEASETQWADPENVTELHCMRSILQIIDQRLSGDVRLPDSQLEDLWWNLAQRYRAFGQAGEAAAVFDRFGKESDRYTEAQLNAGLAYWQNFRSLVSSETGSIDADELSLTNAKKRIENAIKLLESNSNESKPNAELMSAKWALAQIVSINGSVDQELEYFRQGKYPLIGTITARQKRKPRRHVAVSQEFLSTVFHRYESLLTQKGDNQAAIEALKELAARSDPNSTSDIAADLQSIALVGIKRLLQASSITPREIDDAMKMLDQAKSESSESDWNDLLWVADSLGKLANRMETEGNEDAAFELYRRADELAVEALRSNEVTDQIRYAAQLRQLAWMERTGNQERTFELVKLLLNETPDAIKLQFLATIMLEDRAIENDSVAMIQKLIEGFHDTKPQIWGWAKLASRVQLYHSASNHDDPDGNDLESLGLDRSFLLELHFHLARCQWLLANLSSESPARNSWSRKLERQKAYLQLMATDDSSKSKQWRDAIQGLSLSGRE